MYCYKCGAQLQEGQRFCPDCGTQVGVSKENSPASDNEMQQVSVTVKSRRKRVLSIIVIAFVIGFFIAVGITINYLNESAGSIEKPKTTEASETSVNVILDATKFIVQDERRSVTESEFLEIMGEPDSVEEWKYSLNTKEYYPIKTLTYEDVEYHFNNDYLQRISFHSAVIPYENKEDILAMFGLKKYANSKVTDTNTAYRVYNCGVNDFWCLYDEETKTLSWITISYSSLFG